MLRQFFVLRPLRRTPHAARSPNKTVVLFGSFSAVYSRFSTEARTPRGKVAQPEDAPAVRKHDAVAEGLVAGTKRQLGASILSKHL